jgi:hypothetical protein
MLLGRNKRYYYYAGLIIDKICLFYNTMEVKKSRSTPVNAYRIVRKIFPLLLLSLFLRSNAFSVEKRDFFGFDTNVDIRFGANAPGIDSLFGFSTEVLRTGLSLTWGPGGWFIRFRAGAVLLPGPVFGLSAGLAFPLWEFYLENGQRLLGLTAFADIGFPFEGVFHPDFGGGILMVFTPDLIGLSLGLRYSSRQGFLPFVAYSGGYLSGKITAKGEEQ